VTGWTFATAGEPDLDRVIRLQPDGTWPRPLGPRIGVKVVSASVDGVSVPALVNARVELLDDPVFEGRNGLAFEDGLEPIFPLHVRVAGSRVTFQRRHAYGDDEWLQAPGTFQPPSPKVASRLRVATPEDWARFRRTRRAALEKALESETDLVKKLALELRLSWLAGPPERLDTRMLGAGMTWRADVAGPDPVVEVSGLKPEIDAVSPWRFTLWMGVWDADALCAYVTGQLDIPTLSL
jgi:hypothetical protein